MTIEEMMNLKYEEGKAEGIKEINLEIAKKLKEENIDPKIISKCTDLSLGEIENL